MYRRGADPGARRECLARAGGSGPLFLAGKPSARVTRAVDSNQKPFWSPKEVPMRVKCLPILLLAVLAAATLR